MSPRKRIQSVDSAIVNSLTLTVRTVTYLPRERVHIDRILEAFLSAARMRPLKNKLSYCVHELAGNAKRANTKRLFFQERNFDIVRLRRSREPPRTRDSGRISRGT